MSSLQSATSIRLEIQKIKQLPPLPVIAQKLLGAIENENTSIDDIAHIIQSDPVLTSRILGLANSAFFCFSRKLYQLTEAIVNVLGLDLVKALGLTMVMSGVFDTKKCKGFDVERHWTSAFMTAELCTRILRISKTEEDLIESQVYLYGLLHNFGILILVDKFPKLMTDIFEVARKNSDRRLIYTERALLDMDHHQAGSWIAEKWQLPEDVSIVIENHHYADYRGEHWQAAQIVGLSSRMARNWILGSDILVPDEPELMNALSISPSKIKKVAMKTRDKLEGVTTIAREMSG